MEFVKPAIIGLVLVGQRFIDQTDQTTIDNLRIMFVVCSLLTWSIYGLIYFLVKNRNDKTALQISENEFTPPAPTAAITSFFSGSEPAGGKIIDTTVFEYDMAKWTQSTSPILMSQIIVFGIHLYTGFVLPLIMQSFLPLVGAATSELARIYLWGSIVPSTVTPLPKDLRRPWHAAGMMSQFKQLKKEVMQQLNDGKDGSSSRRNKKDENRKRMGK